MVSINDINPDINNLAYLANYDSTYGPRETFLVPDEDQLQTSGRKIKVTHSQDISEVEWEKNNVDVVIDSSGILENLNLARNLKGRVKNVIVTNSPSEKMVDKTVIYGVNHLSIDKKNDFLISSSICDATAFAPFAQLINNEYEITEGFLTTLHPWLGYQNLLDGPSKSYAQPGKIYDDYVLGRSSIMSLIPKNTSAITATYKVLPELQDKFVAMSYRVPTSIVSSADATLKVSKNISIESLTELLIDHEAQNPKIIKNNFDPLVSNDFIRSDYSVIIDHRFLTVSNGYIKCLSWYDNEWGYSSKVIDLVKYINNPL